MDIAEDSGKATGDVIKTRTATLWIGADGIGRVVRNPGAEEDFEDVKAIVEAGRKLVKGRKIPNLSDIRGAKSVTREARQYFRQETDKLVKASAILVDSSVSMALGNFYMAVNRPSYPTRLFTSEPDAIEWLKGFVR
jgi:hypothetical protein